MLLCARFIVLKQFLDQTPSRTTPAIARRRWVLFQALPPLHKFEYGRSDVFVDIIRSLRFADTQVMLNITGSTFRDIATKRSHIFRDERLFVVIDEAQAAANILKDDFPSTTDPLVFHSVLHELYRFLHDSEFFAGIVVSGTGLSSEIVKRSLGSTAAKAMSSLGKTVVFTGTGVFTEPEQEAYIRRHLTLSEEVVSDRRLLERIRRWFIGRCVPCSGFFDLLFNNSNSHRLTASLIELYLHSPDAPRHRILSEFVKYLTGFTITDAIELEDEEGPIPEELLKKIQLFGPLCPVNHLFEEPDSQYDISPR